MAKMGTYGIIRFDLSLFPRAVVDLAPLLLTLGVIGILYGAIVACVTRDLKRLVAYSSLAHLGFIVLGTFALTTQAVTGGVLQMVNHGLIIAVLFIVIGWIYERRRTWQASELRGLQRPAPVLAGGVHGGPAGHHRAARAQRLRGRVPHPGRAPSSPTGGGPWWPPAGVVLAAIYMLWAYQQAFHHEPDAANATTPDLVWREGAVVAPLIVLILFLGVYPKPVLDRITPVGRAWSTTSTRARAPASRASATRWRHARRPCDRHGDVRRRVP